MEQKTSFLQPKAGTSRTPTPWVRIISQKENHIGEVFFKQKGTKDNFIFKVYKDHDADVDLLEAAPKLLEYLKECLLLIDDFMPNIGHCVLQNYQRMNEAPMNARTLIRKIGGN